MANELDRAAARSTGAVGLVHQRDPILSLPACREARNFRLGPGQPRARRRSRRGAPQAAVRLLLHQIFLALARRPDLLPDDQDDADGIRLALATALALPGEDDQAAALTFDRLLIRLCHLFVRMTRFVTGCGFGEAPFDLLASEKIIEVHENLRIPARGRLRVLNVNGE